MRPIYGLWIGYFLIAALVLGGQEQNLGASAAPGAVVTAVVTAAFAEAQGPNPFAIAASSMPELTHGCTSTFPTRAQLPGRIHRTRLQGSGWQPMHWERRPANST